MRKLYISETIRLQEEIDATAACNEAGTAEEEKKEDEESKEAAAAGGV